MRHVSVEGLVLEKNDMRDLQQGKKLEFGVGNVLLLLSFDNSASGINEPRPSVKPRRKGKVTPEIKNRLAENLKKARKMRGRPFSPLRKKFLEAYKRQGTNGKTWYQLSKALGVRSSTAWRWVQQSQKGESS